MCGARRIESQYGVVDADHRLNLESVACGPDVVVALGEDHFVGILEDVTCRRTVGGEFRDDGLNVLERSISVAR
jgi:hypothetical protein